jgi:maltodextrin utilization protein YvdJ
MEKKSVGDEIYSGAASFGRIYAWISAVIGTLIAICMCIFGVYIIQHKRHLKTVDGEVTKTSYDCSTQTQDKSTTKTCKFDVTYRVDGTDYKDTFFSTNTPSLEEKITIWYDPNHPEKGEINPISKTIGIVLIVLSIVVIIGVWVSVWLTKRYKFAAAGMGTAAVVGMI